ncbi:MAG: M15 family metallopeptidase [Elusimicrobiaceae bacterium]|nr:M15 family metallopeptidase [Elusimicrobiaceae bacterium]
MKKISLLFVLLVGLLPMVQADTVSTDKSGFDKIYNVIDDAVFDLRYYSPYNFTGHKITGYKAPIAYMTKEALQALSKAAADLRAQGYRILVWDSYRPQKAVDDFVKWINDPQDPGNKSFYPELQKSDLISGDYVMPKSGHTRGSTIDLTIVKQDGSFVDMGGTFDLFSERSHPDYKKLTKQQKANRKILRDAMIKAGFKPLETEWWHFTLKDEPYKDTYFNFDVE